MVCFLQEGDIFSLDLSRTDLIRNDHRETFVCGSFVPLNNNNNSDNWNIALFVKKRVVSFRHVLVKTAREVLTTGTTCCALTHPCTHALLSPTRSLTKRQPQLAMTQFTPIAQASELQHHRCLRAIHMDM